MTRQVTDHSEERKESRDRCLHIRAGVSLHHCLCTVQQNLQKLRRKKVIIIIKMLTVSALVCAMMVLTRAAALPEAAHENGQPAKSHPVKSSTACSGRWSEFSGRCFHYVPKAMTWAQAEKNCESMGGNLASVHNLLEYHEIQRLIMSASYDYTVTWIGGSDAQEEGVWLWSDGTPFNYRSYGRFNNFQGKQHCLQINYGDDKRWDDTWCNVRLPSVCAKKP
ncbi:type-2 ice-structuring protein-like [Micropterus salmoides]|uniref:type-2 ice-structuring protein-like n=1 Tax=Micropterus salmoides TaxID=27706 RepID=UPI0018ED4275|nr:type-2 ice-structuring protein-like [Micropterus salmoides]